MLPKTSLAQRRPNFADPTLPKYYFSTYCPRVIPKLVIYLWIPRGKRELTSVSLSLPDEIQARLYEMKFRISLFMAICLTWLDRSIVRTARASRACRHSRSYWLVAVPATMTLTLGRSPMTLNFQTFSYSVKRGKLSSCGK